MANILVSTPYPTAEEVADLLGVPEARLDAVRKALAEAPVAASAPHAGSAGVAEGLRGAGTRDPGAKDAARRALERAESLIDDVVARVERTLLARMEAAAAATAQVELAAQEQLQAAADAARRLERALNALTTQLGAEVRETLLPQKLGGLLFGYPEKKERK